MPSGQPTVLRTTLFLRFYLHPIKSYPQKTVGDPEWPLVTFCGVTGHLHLGHQAWPEWRGLAGIVLSLLTLSKQKHLNISPLAYNNVTKVTWPQVIYSGLRLNLTSLSKRFKRGDLIETYKLLTGKLNINSVQFFEGNERGIELSQQKNLN